MSRLHKNNNLKKPPSFHDKRLACLDLHGQIQQDAIRSFTNFTERHSTSWVKVITGTGKHSNGGPVLKTAIASLLQKREMQFHYEKGCFLVNCNSGHVLIKSVTKKCTKIHVIETASQQEKDEMASLQRVIQKKSNSKPSFSSHDEPLPRQVAEYDSALDRAKQDSVADYNLQQSMQSNQFQADLTKAMEASQSELDVELDLEQALTEQLQQAFFLSRQAYSQEYNENDDEFQQEMQQAIKLSRQEHEPPSKT